MIVECMQRAKRLNISIALRKDSIDKVTLKGSLSLGIVVHVWVKENLLFPK